MKRNLRLITSILLMSFVGFFLYNFFETDLEKSITLLVFGSVAFLSTSYLIFTFDKKKPKIRKIINESKA